MLVTFDKKYLHELYELGKSSDKKHRYQPAIIKKYRYCIDILIASINTNDLLAIRSLNYEVLKGDRQGISSIRVNLQYRIEFTICEVNTEPVVTICNIIELSNHYK